ncbi:Hemolysin, contains CBS domains [Nannocystis exedens]|uniref:Hemolysin, contains CBS domains n=1 Tax=Nannocystis exedens TaxID=54 RepID=A0A1I1ZMF2_9BACT|nr:hemolysin family protein [Nannocystis exedens]PCC75418.1 Magnesium and cobalt efflux protein CorC [Nannocystis exedens]SFE32887.1 Hemolysin, contains CBS domains [Nannocystis exedens]
MSDLLRLVSLFFLVLMNGFFVAAEFALVSVRRTRIEQLANEGNTLARLTHKVLQDLDLYIAATQLGITMASLLIGFIAEPAIEHLVAPSLLEWGVQADNVKTISFALAFGLSTALHIVFGELAPKSLALQRAEQVSLAIAVPMIAFTTVFRPVIWLLNVTGNGVVRMFGLRPVPGHHSAHSEEEIRMIVSASRQEGVLEEQEKELLNNVFDLSDTPVRAIMTPRVDMIALEENASLRRFMAINEEHQYSRVPIYRDTNDKIVGIAYVGDVLKHLDHLDEVTLGSVARPAVFAPENMKVIDLFSLFQKKKTHMAIVVDEFGGTAGVVTLEDALEEVVGEIYDENDEPDEEKQILDIGDGTFLFDALINVSEVEKTLAVDLDDEIQGNYETLSGFLFHKFEYIPQVGEEVEAEGWTFHVAEADERRVIKIRAYRKQPPTLETPA